LLINYSHIADIENLVSQIDEYSLVQTINSENDIEKIIGFYNEGIASSKTVNLSIDISTDQAKLPLSVDGFSKLAFLDSQLTDVNLISENYPTGISILDSAENIENLLTNTDDIAGYSARDLISSINSTSDSGIVNLTWQEYLSAITGASFNENDENTWQDMSESNAFSNLGNVEFVVNGSASDIQSIISNYADQLADFPSGITFSVSGGGEISLSSTQLNTLYAAGDCCNFDGDDLTIKVIGSTSVLVLNNLDSKTTDA